MVHLVFHVTPWIALTRKGRSLTFIGWVQGGELAPHHDLLACRFTNAERLFREEANLMSDTAAGTPADPGVFQDLVLFNVAGGDARRFLEEYDRLAAWIDNSLDLYKVQTPENQHICRH